MKNKRSKLRSYLIDKLQVGLMAFGNDGILYTPKGKRLFRSPIRSGARIQASQHLFVGLSWKTQCLIAGNTE